MHLDRDFHGKLVWKVDWPMRWAYEGVVFEPSGVDHQSPGSSFVVGGHLAERHHPARNRRANFCRHGVNTTSVAEHGLGFARSRLSSPE